jgi:hypothetical protein
MTQRSLLPEEERVRPVDESDAGKQPPGAVLTTDNRELIREWAAKRAAQPATGEATQSGPATVDVRDGGAGIRFNFPGAAQFRPISWEEWFDNLTRHDLMFVYEADVPGQTPSGRYRLVPRAKLMQQSREGPD